MSGLFSYNSNSTPKTPNRRTTLNPFCFAQDVTVDGSFGYRSPSCSNLHSGGANGIVSPTHGLSLKEFDEKLKALQKENFNLKFRVYFLETSLGNNALSGASNSAKSPVDEESFFKQNIDLKVEIEELRKELQEKQELLCQAAKAIELMEKQKDVNTMEKVDLEHKIHSLEEEIRTSNSLQSQPSSASMNSTVSAINITQIENEFKSKIAELEQTIKSSELKIMHLTDQLDEAQQKLYEYDQNKSSDSRLVSFANDTGGVGDSSIAPSAQAVTELECRILSQKQQLADKLCVIQDLEEKLAAKTKAHDKGCKTIQLLLMKTQELDAEIESLKSKNVSPNQPDTESMDALKAELQAARYDAEQAHRWRNECAEVCSVLTSRLKELAGFLDSLLKHKDVLSVLAQDRHKAMRKAVDNSLDLSRSINSMTSQGRLSLNEQSMLQMSSFTDVLKDSFFAGRFSFDETDTRNSILIENLRTEVQTLKSELDRIKMESNANTSANGVAASNDARRERMVQYDLNSESEEWSEPDRQVSNERIGLNESIKMNTHLRSPCTGKFKSVVSSSGSDENDSRNLSRKNSILRFQEKILDLETQLVGKDTELAELNTLNDDLKREIESLNGEIKSLEEQHEREIDDMIGREEGKLEALNEKLTKKFEKEVEDRMVKYREMVGRDYIERNRFDDIVRDNEKLEHRLCDTETLLRLMRDNEEDMKHQIADKEQLVRDLKRSADEATLATSKAVLERTKFMNERDHFERLSRELKERVDTLATESSELHSKLAKLSHDNAQLHSKLVINETQFQLTRSASQGNARYALSPKANMGGYGAGSSGDQSGYTSDEPRLRLENSSPDLGIDSDGTARSSGTDINTSRSQLNRTTKTDLNDSFNNILLECEEENDQMANLLSSTNNKSAPKSPSIVGLHDCEKVDKENAELRRKLDRTRRLFEKTWAQLRISNQRKEQIEKDIRQEIYKTHSVLKNVRSNIENVNRANTANKTPTKTDSAAEK